MSPVNLALSQYKLNHKRDVAGPLLEYEWPSFEAHTNPVLKVSRASAGDHIIPGLPPLLDQLNLGSCAANAGAGALEILLNNEGALRQLSRLHLYWIARAVDGTTTEDAGTYLSSIVQQMHKIGVCDESVWTYEPDALVTHAGNRVKKFICPPPVESDIRASENRVSGYYRINTTGAQRLADITTAIRANHPVIFGTEVGDGFIKTKGITPVLPDPKDMQGGHATCLVGVQTIAGRQSFMDKNSWGPGWAAGGYCWLDQDYMTWGETSDIWVITRMSPLL